MHLRNITLIAGILLAGIFSGSFVQSSANGRNEDPSIPQVQYTKIKSALEASNRGMSPENNMMLYRSVFMLSLKLLTLFLIVRLFGYSVSGAGHGSGPYAQYQSGVGGHGGYQTQQQQLPALDVNYNPANAIVTATSTGAAAGASTGGAAGVVGLANAGAYQTVPAGAGGYQIAATNPRPSFLLPRFRFGFGGPRHPPYRQPPPHMMMNHPVSHHNMGGETHLVETHSHLYVLPDGSQARVPVSASASSSFNQPKPATTSNSQTGSSTSNDSAQKTEAKSAPSETTAESSQVENVIVSTSSSTSQQPAQRRSSLAYKEKLSQLQQAYEDWSLHFNPGTRSL